MTKRREKKQPPAKSKKKKITEEPSELLIWETEQFVNDLECLSELFHEVVPILDRKDKARADKMKALTEKLANDSSEAKKERKAVNLTDTLKEFLDAAAKHSRANIIFRRNAVVSVISRFEEFLGTILSIAYKQHPVRFANSEKTVSYQEILSLNDASSPLDLVVAKEVDDVLRKGPDDQLKHIDRDFKLGLLENFKERSAFVEICERRNLFAHTGGQVSKQYLQVCTECGFKFDKVPKLGSPLGVDESYFENASVLFSGLGLRLGQTLLRRLFANAFQDADESLNRIGYSFLSHEEYRLAECVFDFALTLGPKHVSSDSYGKMFLINRCIAIYFQGRKVEMKKALASVDWSSADPKFVLAVNILNEEFDSAAKLMGSFSPTFPISEDDYLRWPLFREFRKTETFKNAYKVLYGKDPTVTPTILAEIGKAAQSANLTGGS